MTDELTKENIRQEALESNFIGADRKKFTARVVHALVHNKLTVDDLPLDYMPGFEILEIPERIQNKKKK